MDYQKLEIEKNLQIISDYLKSKNFIAAEKKAKELIKKFPNNLTIYNLLGLSLHFQNKLPEAIKNFKFAIDKNPNFFSALNNLGITYYSMGDLINAQSSFEKAIKVNPKFVMSIYNLGNVKKELNNIDEAIKIYKEALKIDNKNQIVLNNLGSSLQNIGKFKEAKEYFELSININPKNGQSHRLLSMLSKYDMNNTHLKKMKNIIKNNSLDDIQKAELYFALGKAYEDIGDYNTSFKNFLLGNNLKRKKIHYEINDDVKLFNNIKKSFSKINFRNLRDLGVNNKKMIFVLGMLRSGTTLVEQIISNHKNVYGAGELRILDNIIKENFSIDGKITFPEKINIKNKEFFYKTGKKYINKTKVYNSNQIYMTDKDPLNFRWIGFIKLILPKSKIVHCVRDSKDTCASLLKNFFSERINFAFTQEELGKYYNLYHDLMEFWKQSIPDFIYDISYEKLIENQELETRKLLNFCNLDWDKSCLNFFENRSPIKTLSTVQVRNPIYKSSIKSWKNYENNILPLIHSLKN